MKVQLLLSATALSILSQQQHLVSARSLRAETTTTTTTEPTQSIEETASRDDGRESRIINGVEATPGEYAFAASLDDGEHFCGGSLIARDVVLTAAHCQGGSYRVAVGRHDWTTNQGQIKQMQREEPHPNYNDRKTDYDFMLVFLNGPVTLNADVNTVRLNPQDSLPADGSSAIAMGWGVTRENGSLSDVLMEVGVNVMSNQECSQSSDGRDTYQGDITENMLCASDRNEDSCQGDSGGPLITSNGVQIGVVSWGIGCADPNFPGVYSRVSKAYDWIEYEACKGSQYAVEAGFDCANASYNGSSLGGGSSGSGSGSGGTPQSSPSPPSPSPPTPTPPTPTPPSGGDTAWPTFSPTTDDHYWNNQDDDYWVGNQDDYYYDDWW